MPKQTFKTYSIQQAAVLLKVSTKTLRRWEARGVITPVRTDGGHRRYTIREIQNLKPKDIRKHTNKAALPVAPIVPSVVASTYTAPPQQRELETSAPAPIEVESKPRTEIEEIFIAQTSPEPELYETPTYSVVSSEPIQKKRATKYVSVFTLLIGIVLIGHAFKGAYGQVASSRKIVPTVNNATNSQVLADTSTLELLQYKLNIPATFAEIVTIDSSLEVNETASIDGTLTLGNGIIESGVETLALNADTTSTSGNLAIGGTTITSAADLTIDAGGGGVKIGTGTQALVDLAGDDLFVSGDTEIAGTTYIETLVINGDSFTDLTGTGLQVSAGVLSTTLGTSVTGDEIENDTIKEVDLTASNDATGGQVLSYNASTGGFTWIAAASSLFTDGAGVTYLTDTAENLTIGSSTNLAKIGADGVADEVQLLAQGHSTQTSDIFVVEASDGTNIFSVGNTGNTTLTNSGTSNTNINLTSTGDFTIQDNSSTFATFTDSGTFVIDSLTLDGTSISSSGNLTLTPTSNFIVSTLDCSANTNGGALTANGSGVISCSNDDGGGGASDWTSAAGLVTLQTTTNNVNIGGSTNLAKLSVVGDTDEIEFLVRGNATQTTNLGVFEQSDGTDVFTIANTGNLATAGDLAVNGGDITTSATTFNLLNSTATTVNFAGAATTLNIGVSGGTLTIPSNVTITGTLTTAASNFAADGAATFSPSGTNDVTMNLDADSTLILNGLQSGTASSGICLDASNNVITCSAAITIDLQDAYDNDTDGSNVSIVLSATDDSIIFQNPSSLGTDSGYIQLLNQLNTGNVDGLQIANEGTGDSIQITNSSTGSLLNLSTSGAVTTADGILIAASNASGVITDAVDVSDAEIVNAINVGANTIVGTSAVIDFTNFDVDASGNTTIGGNLSANGTFTLGDNGDTGSINTSDWDISATGDLTGIGAITADGAISFTPSGTSDITFTTDADSSFILSGLSSGTGTALCIDGTNNIVTCASGSAVTGSGAANRVAYWSSASALTSSANFTFDPAATTGNTFAISNTGLTTGSALSVTGTSTATTNTALSQNVFAITNAQSTLANTNGIVGVAVNFTNNPSVAGNTEYAIQIQNQATSNVTDNAVAALLRLDNADTSTSGSTVVTNGLLITNSGDIAGGITNGINIDDTDITTDIVLQNDETIDNNTDGTILLTAPTVQTSAALAVGGAATLNGNVTLGDAAADLLTFSGTIQGASPFVFEGATADAFETTFAITDPTSDQTITFPNDTGTVCLTTGNCAGSGTGVTTSGGTTNRLAKFTASQAIGDSSISDDGTTVSIIANVGLSLSSGTGLLSQTYTPAGTTATATGATFTPTFGIDATDQILTGITINPNTNSNTDSGDLLYGINIDNITGTSATEVGLRFGSGYDYVMEVEGATNDGIETYIAFTDPTSTDKIITFPDDTGTVCLSSGNCSGGAGGSKWTDGGTTTYLTATGDNLAVGGSDSTAEFFIDIANGGNVAIISSADTETALGVTANSLTTGRVSSFTGTNTATTNTAISQNLFSITNAQATNANTAGFVGLGVNFTNNPTVAGNTEYAAQIQNQATSNITDNAVAALLRLDNADTSSVGSTVVTNALLITNSGDVSGGITNGINIDDTDITTDIVLQNDETIDNNTDGTVLITAPTTQTSGGLTVAGSAGITLSSTTADITFGNGESINNDTDGRITIAGGDLALSSTTGDLIFGNGESINNDTDGTIAISATTLSFSGTTISATSATTLNCSDCIDFDDIADSLTLDANLSLAQSTNTWSQSFTGTTTTGFAYTANSLTTGRALSIAGTNTATSNTALQQNLFDITNAQSTTANTNGITGFAVNFTNNPSVAGNTEYAARIQNQVTSNTTDNAVRALLLLDNADTSVAGSTVVTDALLITNSGDVSGGITNGINIDDTDITTDIVLQNDETIDNNTDGVIALTATTVTTSAALTVNGTLTANGVFTLGDNGDTGSINTSDWDISATGDLTGIGAITADGAISFTPGSTSDITFTLDSDSTLILSGVQTGTASNGLCLDASNNVITCSTTGSVTLQQAYDNDTDGSDAIIALTTADDSLVLRNPASSGTDSSYILTLDQLANAATGALNITQAGTGAGIAMTFSNAGTTTDGLIINNSAGTITDAIDVSDATGITNALNIGANAIVGTTANIDLTNFDVAGGTGNITTVGDLAVNGDDITSDSNLTIAATGYVRIGDSGTPGVATGDDDLYVEGDFEVDATATFDSTVTVTGTATLNGTLDANGQVDLGDGGDAITISGTTVAITSNGATNDITLTTADDLLINPGDDILTTFVGGSQFIIDADTANSTLDGTTGGVFDLNVGTSTSGNIGFNLDYVFDDDADATDTVYAASINLTNDSADAADVLFGQRIVQTAQGTATGDKVTDALLLLDNADTATGDDITVTDALRITNSGAIAAGIIDAIDVSDSTITNAVNAGANFFLLDAIRIFEGVIGTLTIEDTSGNDLLTLVDGGTTGSLTVTNTISAQGTTLGLNNDASANNVISFGTGPGAATGDLYWGDKLLCTAASANCGWSAGSGMTSFTAAGDSGGGQAITDGNTLSVLGGTNGIDTIDSVTDTITLNLDTTEIGTTTFGSGSAIVWTFDASAGTDTSLTFGNNTQTLTTGTLTLSGTTALTGTSLTAFTGGATAIDFTEFDVSATTGSITINDDGDAGSINIESTNLDINDLTFVGAGTLATGTASNLTINSGTTGSIALGDDASAETITLGTGAAAKTVTLGSTNTTSATTIQSGTGDVTISSADDVIFNLLDNNTDALDIQEGSNNYFNINTTNSSENIALSTNRATGGDAISLTGNSITTGVAVGIDANAITTGTALDLTSTSAVITAGTSIANGGTTLGSLLNVSLTGNSAFTGNLGTLDWSPTSATVASGDIFQINIGSNGTTSGYLFNISDTGTSLFNVSEAQITSTLPHQFTAAGDVAIAYDIQFTNQTASSIKSNAPLTLDVGESFESNALTLRTYNSGNVIVDLGTTAGKMSIGANITPLGLLHVSNTGTGAIGKALAIFDQDESQHVITASASGVSKFVVDNAGKLYAGALDVETANTTATCWFNNTINGVTLKEITDCNGTPTDLAEYFGTTDTSIEAGDIVRFDGQAEPVIVHGTQTSKAFVQKANSSYDNTVFGIVSTAPNQVYGDDGVFDPSENPRPVSLAGRVPVKVTTQNGTIKVGDAITSSTVPGIGMKATANGFIVGRAMQDYNESDSSTVGKIIVYVNPTYYDPIADTGTENASDSADVSELASQLTTLQINFDNLVDTSLTASDSGILASFSDVNTNSLSVLGDTVLSDTVINGKLNIGAMTFDNTDQSINAIGTLKIQSLALGNIELQGGLVTIDTTGNVVVNTITAQKYRVAGTSAGVGTLSAGASEISITTDMVTANSLIFVTPKKAISTPLAVIEKVEGESFTVAISEVSLEDIEFDWFIVDKVN